MNHSSRTKNFYIWWAVTQPNIRSICIFWWKVQNLLAICERNKNQLVVICASLFPCVQHTSLMWKLATADAKWPLCQHEETREWLIPNTKIIPRAKVSPHPQNMMLCVWWNKQGDVFYYLLPSNVTIAVDMCLSK